MILKKMGDTKRCCFPQEFRPLWRKTRPPSVYLQTDSNQNRSWTSASCPLLLPVIHSHSRIVMHSQSPTNSRLRTLCRSMKHHIHRSSQIFTDLHCLFVTPQVGLCRDLWTCLCRWLGGPQKSCQGRPRPWGPVSSTSKNYKSCMYWPT